MYPNFRLLAYLPNRWSWINATWSPCSRPLIARLRIPAIPLLLQQLGHTSWYLGPRAPITTKFFPPSSQLFHSEGGSTCRSSKIMASHGHLKPVRSTSSKSILYILYLNSSQPIIPNPSQNGGQGYFPTRKSFTLSEFSSVLFPISR